MICSLSNFVLVLLLRLPSCKILTTQSWRDDWIRETINKPEILENNNDEIDLTTEISDKKLEEDVDRILKEIV